MTNVLITGISGFIGSHLAKYLSNDPENKVYGIVRSEKVASTFNALNLHGKENINIIYGDVYVYTMIEELLIQYNIDQIYHLASKVIVRDAAKSPLTTYMINVNGTLNVLEAIRLIKVQYNKDIPTLVMSSDKAYGIHNKLPYTESHCLNGNDTYSSSKAIMDMLARTYASNYDLPITVSRPCNTFGEYDFNWSRIVPTLAKSCFDPEESGKPLILNNNSYNYTREYMYVEDTVAGLVSLISNIDKTRGEAFNISSGERLSTEQVADIFFLIADTRKEIEFKEKESIFKEIPEQYLDTSKIKKVTGWESKYTFETGLKNAVEGYKKWFGAHVVY